MGGLTIFRTSYRPGLVKVVNEAVEAIQKHPGGIDDLKVLVVANCSNIATTGNARAMEVMQGMDVIPRHEQKLGVKEYNTEGEQNAIYAEIILNFPYIAVEELILACQLYENNKLTQITDDMLRDSTKYRPQKLTYSHFTRLIQTYLYMKQTSIKKARGYISPERKKISMYSVLKAHVEMCVFAFRLYKAFVRADDDTRNGVLYDRELNPLGEVALARVYPIWKQYIGGFIQHVEAEEIQKAVMQKTKPMPTTQKRAKFEGGVFYDYAPGAVPGATPQGLINRKCWCEFVKVGFLRNMGILDKSEVGEHIMEVERQLFLNYSHPSPGTKKSLESNVYVPSEKRDQWNPSPDEKLENYLRSTGIPRNEYFGLMLFDIYGKKWNRVG